MDNFRSFLENALNNINLDDTSSVQKHPEYNLQEEIPRLLLSARNSANITQKQLAEQTGLSQANISRFENGQVLPSLPTLKKISDALGKKLVIKFDDFKEDEYGYFD